MPVKWELWDGQDSSSRHAIICQSATSFCQDHAKIRYIIIFIIGNFTLDDANSFAIEAFDSKVIPDKDMFFENPPDVCSTAFSAVKVPQSLECIVNNFSTMDFIDEYTFHLLYHSADFFFQRQSRAEEMIDKRAKRRQDEWARLLAAEVW